MPLFYKSDPPGDPAAARARAKPFRLIQMISVGDAVAGMLLHYLSPRLGVPGEAMGMPVLEFVGLALIVIGAVGYVLFEFLARAAMKRTDPPRPLR
jgi:fructose-specific phosphotransferase system IIC component